jgi:formate-dependent nitrite reductase membrane component NrfD
MGGYFHQALKNSGRKAVSEVDDSRSASGYYGVPAIHKPHWKWLIINYFFFGGISSASYVIAAVAGMSKSDDNRAIARAGHYVSFAALLPCPVFLILDLGQPARFLNMVRHFNPRSPMSLGTWGLLTFSIFSGSSAITQAMRDGFFGTEMRTVANRAPSHFFGAAGAIPGFFVGGYTGVLLGATAVPIWAKSANLLGPLFLSSALSSASSAMMLALVLSGNEGGAQQRLEEVERIAIVAEACLLAAVVTRLGPTAKPLREGHLNNVMKYGVIGAGIIAPLALHFVNRRRRSRSLTVAGSILGLAGGFSLRYAVVLAGHDSADDPQATFDFAR